MFKTHVCHVSPTESSANEFESGKLSFESDFNGGIKSLFRDLVARGGTELYHFPTLIADWAFGHILYQT